MVAHNRAIDHDEVREMYRAALIVGESTARRLAAGELSERMALHILDDLVATIGCPIDESKVARV